LKNEMEGQIGFQSIGSVHVVFQNSVAEVNGTNFFPKRCTSGTYQHIPQSAHTASKKKLLRMDRYGPKHVELTPEHQ
jgi:hypothetical protein